MPQTMLGLLALVLASLVAFNQQRLQRRAYEGMIRDELEVAATGTAQNVIELIAARSFDEESTPETLFLQGAEDVPRAAGEFSPGGAFGDGDRGADGCDLRDPAATPDCDDVDDLDGVSGSVDVDLGDGRSLPFNAAVRVDYVTGPADSAAVATSPTLHKRVSIVMTSPLFERGRAPILSLSRVLSYDPIKAEFDYERRYGALGAGSPSEVPGPGGEVPGPGEG